jgi:hypothetical protein
MSRRWPVWAINTWAAMSAHAAGDLEYLRVINNRESTRSKAEVEERKRWSDGDLSVYLRLVAPDV